MVRFGKGVHTAALEKGAKQGRALWFAGIKSLFGKTNGIFGSVLQLNLAPRPPAPHNRRAGRLCLQVLEPPDTNRLTAPSKSDEEILSVKRSMHSTPNSAARR